MTIKIQCPCGVKYAFEVSPETAAKPVQFICQHCGQDSSAVVNQIIQQQLGMEAPAATPPPAEPAAPSRPRVHINLPAEKMAAAPSPVAQPTLQLSAQKPVQLVEREEPAEAAASSAEPAEIGTPEAAAQTCLKHVGEVVVESCLVCKKPLCAKCMELFGYVCSAYCQAQAEKLHIHVPVYAHQKMVVEANYWRKIRWLAAGIVTFLLTLAGLWAWYANFASQPKVVFTVALPPADYSESECKLVGPDQAVLRHGNKLTRYDLKKKAEVWSTQLIDKKQIAQAAAKELAQRKAQAEKWKAERAKKGPRRIVIDQEEVILPDTIDETPVSEAEQLQSISKYLENSMIAKLKLHLEGKEVWMVFPNKVAHYNWDAGKPDKEIPVPEQIKRVEGKDNALFFISQTQTGREIFTRISLPGGEIQTEQGPEPAVNAMVLARTNLPGKAALVSAGTNALKTASGKSAAPKGAAIKAAQTVAAQKTAAPVVAAIPRRDSSGDDSGARPDDDFLDASRTEFIFAGQNIARLSVKLLEKKVAAYDAMKEKPKTSELEKGVSGANAVAAMNEIVNEWQEERTGGKRKEDQSRYAVTIQRLMAGGAPEWSGEVTGPPELFALKSVDVLVAGLTVTVFDKSNKKLWNGKLAYPIARQFGMDSPLWQLEDLENSAPCLERENRLYLYDQGVLTAYELASGNAHWRLTSVGINKLHFDEKGMMYVATTSAGADMLKYSQQVDLERKVVPVLLKVDPQNGKILWRIKQTGERFYFTGKFIYAVETDASRTDGFVMLGASHLGIYRLDPANGRELWHHFERRGALATDFQKNTIQVLFNNEMEVLRFLSL